MTAPRQAGSNKIGMLAWLVTLATPECPGGRDIILIANDITYQNGTFGPSSCAMASASANDSVAAMLAGAADNLDDPADNIAEAAGSNAR